MSIYQGGRREGHLQLLTESQIAWYNGSMAAEEIKIGEKVFSRRGLARATGLSLSHISRVFSGKRSPSLQTLKTIAKAVKVPVVDVINALPNTSAV